MLDSLNEELHQKMAAECRRSLETLDEAQQRAFGMTGTEATARLLAAWNLPPKATLPLMHASYGFPVLASLPESQRSGAMLVKLAVLLGRIAAGRWEAWDTVDLPSPTVLESLHCPALSDVLARTRRDLEAIVGSLPRSKGPMLPAPESRKIGYVRLGDESFDFLAAILPSLGIVAGGRRAAKCRSRPGQCAWGSPVRHQGPGRLESRAADHPGHGGNRSSLAGSDRPNPGTAGQLRPFQRRLPIRAGGVAAWADRNVKAGANSTFRRLIRAIATGRDR